MHRDWLKPSLIVLRAPAPSAEAVVEAAVGVLAPAAGVEPAEVRTVFMNALQSEGFSLGRGVAIPHVELDGLDETLVCLVTTVAPVPVPSIDGVPPDVFLFVLSRRDPRGHLLLLAHLARLAQSRTFLGGLREARDADEVMELVRAVEERHDATSQVLPQAVPATSHAVVLVSVSGEKLVDALLVALVERGLEHSCVVEAQSLRDAAAHEVPLFAGFRDIFGDPGGRRVLILEAPAEEATAVVSTVRHLCEEHDAEDASISVIPVQTRWRSTPAKRAEAPGAH